MMNKKAVSPLIATVLLIAFTVALGAIVMNWGESFVRKTQDTASSASEGKIECTMEVDFEVVNAVYEETDGSPGEANVSLLIRNAGDKEIAQFVAQVFTNTVRGGRGQVNMTLNSLDVASLEIPITVDWDKFPKGLIEKQNVTTTLSNVTEIRIIPRIDTGALTGPVSCSNRYVTIGKDKLVTINNP